MSLRRSLEELVPSYVAGIRPYVPGKPVEEVERELGLTAIKLASNENPLGPSPLAVEAAAKYLTQSHRYPDAGGYYLREKLAARHNISMDHVVLGAGSTELIQLLCHIYVGPGVKGLGSEGSFVMFPLSVRVAGGKPVLVPLKDYAFDLDAIASRIDDSTRIIYLANPNNPTGTVFTADAFQRFLVKVPEDVLIVLDEAYCDYVENPDYGDSLEHVRAGRYLIVLRTFSKIHGLAGLRVGYGVGHPEIISALNKIRSPFNVAGISQVAALGALRDIEHVQRSLESNRRGLAFLTEELSGLGVKAVPSATNFVYVETGHPPKQVYEALLHQGVIVRPLAWMGMPDGLRVSVGTDEENHRAVEALSNFVRSAQPVEKKASLGD